MGSSPAGALDRRRRRSDDARGLGRRTRERARLRRRPGGDAPTRRSATGSCTAATLPRAGDPGRRRRPRPRCAALTDAGAAAPAASRSPRSTPLGERAPGRARGRLLRHRVPRDAPARPRPPTRCPRVARPLADPALRLPRPVPRAGRASRRDSSARSRRRRHVPPRRRRVAVPRSRDGRCVDTTMGFTPLEGLVMATRSGSVDPGLLLWLLERGRRWRSASCREALEHESGLVGLAGTADMRDVLVAPARATGAAGARRLRAPPAGARSRRWRPRSAASTRSCSPAASASTPAVRAGGRRRPRVPRRRVDAERNAPPATEDIGAGARRGCMVVEAREDLEIAWGSARLDEDNGLACPLPGPLGRNRDAGPVLVSQGHESRAPRSCSSRSPDCSRSSS